MNSKKQSNLTLKEIIFVKYYLFGCKKQFKLGNGTRAYAKAYGKNWRNQNQYNVCSVEAYNLLRNPKIKEYIELVLEETGWNDNAVDARHLQILTDGNNRDALAAIKEYNQLKQRIKKKIDILDPEGGHTTEYENLSEEELDAEIKRKQNQITKAA